MQFLFRVVLGLAFASTLIAQRSKLNISKLHEIRNEDCTFPFESLRQVLEDICQERPYKTLLVVQQNRIEDTTSRAIYLLEGPKVIVSTGAKYEFIRTFNAEIMVVIIMRNDFDHNLMETAAHTLNYMRQSRILILAGNIAGDEDQFKAELLKTCRTYKMTNVLLNFIPSHGTVLNNLHQLQPYPQYKWNILQGLYYPQHWRNLLNATVIFFTDQTMTLSYPYEDGHGQLKLNGYVARLILLFGEVFNAHLQMYDTLEVSARTHFNAVNKLVENNRVDLPMTLTHENDGKWLYKSAVYDQLEGLIMIPSAQTLTIREIYSILLNDFFFGCVVVCTLLFSLLHSLVDYYFDGIWHPTDVVINDRLLSGVLGQSFQPRNAPWLVLKVLYFLVFFAGLNISTQFSATMNTLMTSPPYHPQIQTVDDLNNSPLKIVAVSADIEAIGDTAEPIMPSLLQTDNNSFYDENRNNFNTSTGYFLVSLSWKVLQRKQQYFKRNIFNIYENMTLFRLPCALQLQRHSEYKEPLDYLIHRVQDLGLTHHWYASTFGDMLRTKRISISPPSSQRGFHALLVNDLFWPWIILVCGLAAACVVFSLELLFFYNLSKRCQGNGAIHR